MSFIPPNYELPLLFTEGRTRDFFCALPQGLIHTARVVEPALLPLIDSRIAAEGEIRGLIVCNRMPESHRARSTW